MQLKGTRENRNIFVLSHASDIDGVGSAALIRMKYGVPLSNILFSEYSEEGIGYAESYLSKRYRKGITLFVTDLGVDASLYRRYLRIIKSVKASGGMVFWFDHHPWEPYAVKSIAALCDEAIVGENPKYCAASITWRRLGFSDKFTRELVSLINYSDFNKDPGSARHRKLIGTYALSITKYNSSKSRDYRMSRLRHIVQVLGSGRFTDPRIRKDASAFNALNSARTKSMLRNVILRSDFAIGFSKPVQSTSGCVAIIRSTGAQIGIYVDTESWKGHIRCETKDISLLARVLGGGGHPHASGFPVNYRQFGGLKTSRSRRAYADFIEKKIIRHVK